MAGYEIPEDVTLDRDGKLRVLLSLRRMVKDKDPGMPSGRIARETLFDALAELLDLRGKDYEDLVGDLLYAEELNEDAVRWVLSGY